MIYHHTAKIGSCFFMVELQDWFASPGFASPLSQSKIYDVLFFFYRRHWKNWGLNKTDDVLLNRWHLCFWQNLRWQALLFCMYSMYFHRILSIFLWIKNVSVFWHIKINLKSHFNYVELFTFYSFTRNNLEQKRQSYMEEVL